MGLEFADISKQSEMSAGYDNLYFRRVIDQQLIFDFFYLTFRIEYRKYGNHTEHCGGDFENFKLRRCYAAKNWNKNVFNYKGESFRRFVHKHFDIYFKIFICHN